MEQNKSKAPRNQPAFPIEIDMADQLFQNGKGRHNSRDYHVQYHGLTMRDYFAAKAMSLSNPSVYVGKEQTEKSFKEYADNCYRIADAMLKSREL